MVGFSLMQYDSDGPSGLIMPKNYTFITNLMRLIEGPASIKLLRMKCRLIHEWSVNILCVAYTCWLHGAEFFLRI
jgi:hypothetical protein